MAVPRPSEKEILNRIYNRIRNETPITANLDSSIIGVILKIIAAEMNLVWSYVEELYRQSNLGTATGTALDNFGLLFGLPRKSSREASTLGLTRSVRFTNIGNATFNIPSGTRVFKSTDPQKAFFTVEGATLEVGSSIDVHVTAAGEGEIYNVSIGELDKHSLASTSVAVTNILPIQNGAFEESDASYRERLLQDITRRDSLNVANTDSLLRSVPGVRDVYMLDMKRGAGTFDVVIIPYNESSSSEIVAECQRLLNEYVPVGISALAKPPRYRQLDVRVNIRFKPDSGARRESIRESVRAQISARVDNLPVEDGSGIGTFFTSQIRASAILSGSEVLDAVVTLGLDSSPISNDGEIRLGIGERLVLRSLSVS